MKMEKIAPNKGVQGGGGVQCTTSKSVSVSQCYITPIPNHPIQMFPHS